MMKGPGQEILLAGRNIIACSESNLTTMTERPAIPASIAPRADDAGDRSALERAAQGDSAAFEDIVRTHQEPLSRLAYRLLGWSPEADDVVQEVFLAALKNLGKFRGQCTLTTWLTSITINKCRSQLRKQWVRQAFLRKASERSDEPPHAPAESGLMDREQFQ